MTTPLGLALVLATTNAAIVGEDPTDEDPESSTAPAVVEARPSAPPPPACPSATPPPLPPMAPRFALGLGPGLVASRDGSSFAISVEAGIGVGRRVVLVPWLDFVPQNRTAAGAAGTASFRPTLFGLGAAVPLLDPSSLVVPRVGAGWGLLWMHVSPESAGLGAIQAKPEDLLAPIAYVSGSASVKLAEALRVVADAFVGVASHEMVIRIAGEPTSRWGVPLTGANLRVEWVMR